MQLYKSFNFLLLIIFFLLFNFSAFSSRDDFEERHKSIFGGWHDVDKPLYFKGLSLLIGVVTDKARYELGRKFQKGEIPDFQNVTPERLLIEMACFNHILDTTEKLHLRALHNLAVAQSRLADLMIEKGMPITDTRVTIFYQDAWYHLSLAGLSQSTNSMAALVNNKKINFIVGNKLIEDKLSRRSLIEPFNQRLEKDMEALIKTRFPTLDSNKVSALQQDSRFSTMMESFKNSFKVAADERLKSINQLECEKEEEKNFPQPAARHFTADILSDFESLQKQLYVTSSQTPKLTKEQLNPLIILLGRSVGWLNELHKATCQKRGSNIEVIHVLGSGLSREDYTTEELQAYKTYCDSLGLNKIAKDRPVLLVDIADTAQSLQRFSKIFKHFYDFSDIQFLALMFPGQTLNLPKCRVLYVSPLLSSILFAKHSELARFSFYPQFFHTEWRNWERYLASFKPSEEALVLKKELLEWVNKQKALS